MRKRFVLAVGVVVSIAGCGAQPQPSVAPRNSYPSKSPSPSPTSPAPTSPSPSIRPTSPTATSRSPLPTPTRPSGPPDNPTDQIKKTMLVVVGIVTRGGSGPCFSVQTDDGTEYAVYTSMRLTLSRGQYVRLSTKPGGLRINCGPDSSARSQLCSRPAEPTLDEAHAAYACRHESWGG